MNRKLLLMIVLAFSLGKAEAQKINALVLHMASGKTVTCLLDEQPKVSFKDDDLVIETHMSTVTYNSADVLKFTYVYDPTSVEDVKANGSLFALNGSTLTIRSLAPKSAVTVYSVDGRKVAETTADANGGAVISLPGQSGMTYVVNSSVANFKISMP